MSDEATRNALIGLAVQAIGEDQETAGEVIVGAVVDATTQMGLDARVALEILEDVENSAQTWVTALREDVSG